MSKQLIKHIKSYVDLLVPTVRAGILSVLVIVLVYLLLGEQSGDYVTSVVSNVGNFIKIASTEAIIGIAIVIAIWLMITQREN
jgi:membrane protein DedA with SNARE-associated domain